MKNQLLALVLTLCAGTIAGNCYQGNVFINFDPYCTHAYYNDPYCYNNSDHEHRHCDECLPSEKNLRRQLYWLYKYNPRALELKNFPVDYFIKSLTDHITVLEDKIAAKKSGIRSGAMLRGVMLTAIASVWGYVTRDTYKKVLKGSESFGSVVMLGSITALLTGLAGTQFDRVYRHAERLLERLDRDRRLCAVLEKIKLQKFEEEQF